MNFVHHKYHCHLGVLGKAPSVGTFFWEIETHFRLFEIIVNFTIKMALTEEKILFENRNKIQKI